MQLFGFGREAPNLTAVAQQLFAVCCLYQKKRDILQAYLGQDAEIVIWVENQATYPPSWCLIRQGESDWFLVVEGTTNAVQMADHFGGTFFREDFAGDTLANGAWVSQIESFKLAIIERLGAIPRGRWHTSGHSYGAAIAQLFGYDHIDDYPEDSVEIIGIAAPRAMSAFYTGRNPEAYWRISSNWDLVPDLPPPYASFVSVKWLNPLKWLGSLYVWYHYGTEFIFGWDGQINDTVEFPPDVLPPYVAATFPDVHYPGNYAGRLLQWEKANGPFPIMRDALDRAIDVYQGGRGLEIPWEMPQIIPGPDGDPVLIPTVPVLYTGGGVMANYKVTYNFRGRSGANWNETHTMLSSSAIDAASDEAISTTLLNSRLACLSSVYTLYGATVTQLGGNRVSRKRYIGLPGTYAVTGVPADIAGVALSLKWFGTVAGNKFSWMRGIGDDVITVNTATGVVDLKSTFLTLLGVYAARLGERNMGWIPRVKRNPDVPITDYNSIRSVNGSVFPGFAQLTLMNPVLALAGKYITISQVNQKLLPGLKGKFLLKQASGTTAVVEYQVPGDANVLNPGGRIRVYEEEALNVYTGVAFAKAIGRRTKDAFSPSRASQSARGLRTAR